MSSGDNKIRSITRLVRLLVALTLLSVLLCVVLVYNYYSSEVVHIGDEPQQFVCGTCEMLKRKERENPALNGIDGKGLFKANCTSCHTNTDKDATGPGLMGVLDRIPGGDWKYIFVRDHDSLVRANDPYAVLLYNKYKTRAMRFPQLTNAEIDAILAYVSVSYTQ